MQLSVSCSWSLAWHLVPISVNQKTSGHVRVLGSPKRLRIPDMFLRNDEDEEICGPCRSETLKKKLLIPYQNIGHPPHGSRGFCLASHMPRIGFGSDPGSEIRGLSTGALASPADFGLRALGCPCGFWTVASETGSHRNQLQEIRQETRQIPTKIRGVE